MYLVSRTETFAKLFLLVSFSGLFMYVALAFYSFHTAYSSVQVHRSKFHDLSAENFGDDLKYILVWMVENTTTDIEEGQGILLDNQCKDVNCYITTNKSLLHGGYEQFNAVVFHYGLMRRWVRRFLPEKRSPHQKYVFYSRLPANLYPICSITVNNFFNWTWSYKFGSDIFNPFIEVRDLNNTLVAPSPTVKWPKNTALISPEMNVFDDTKTKSKALVWLMTSCNPKRQHLISIKRLRTALEDHGLDLDIYGCGNLPCPPEGCLEAIERHYYFYLSIEDTVTEDFLTEEVLMAYNHNTVPIIVGGADVTKFLPKGSYISYQGLDENHLASIIAHTIKTPASYKKYFNWQNLYKISSVEQNKGFCQLCTLLNDYNKYTSFSSYDNFRQWWYPGNLQKKCLPKGAETYDELLNYNKKNGSNNRIMSKAQKRSIRSI